MRIYTSHLSVCVMLILIRKCCERYKLQQLRV
uniref:Uncharacterized protein n=1 Tax=Anguilla anguilla TaxID=7936 RepID=A0A0E9TCK1_ANGAN